MRGTEKGIDCAEVITLSDPMVPPESEDQEKKGREGWYAPPGPPLVAGDRPAGTLTAPRRPWSVIGALALLLGTVLVQVAATVPVFIFAEIMSTDGHEQWVRDWAFSLVLAVSSLAVLLLLVLIRKKPGARPLWDWADLRVGRNWLLGGLVLLLCYGANVLRIVLQPDPAVPELNQEFLNLVAHSDRVPWLPVLLGGLAVVVLAPLTEEWFFRGILQPAIARRVGERWGAWVAVPVTAVIFGLLHGLDAWWIAALYGAGIGWLSMRLRSLAMPMLVHGALNLTVYGLVLVGGLSMR